MLYRTYRTVYFGTLHGMYTIRRSAVRHTPTRPYRKMYRIYEYCNAKIYHFIVGHIMQIPGPGHVRISSPIQLRTHFSQAVRSAMVFMSSNGHASSSGGAAGAAARGGGGGGTVDGGAGEARHSLHRARHFLCSQMSLPPHSIQMERLRPCSQMPLPPHGLQRLHRPRARRFACRTVLAVPVAASPPVFAEIRTTTILAPTANPLVLANFLAATILAVLAPSVV